MGSAYDWFDQKRTMEILDESQVVPEARVQKPVVEEKEVPMPNIAPTTENWYNTLPEKVRPTALRCKFPHILEKIKQAWESPRQLDNLFSGIMMDDRGSRQGFPIAAIREIHCLRDYYFDVLQPDSKRLLKPQNGLNTIR